MKRVRKGVGTVSIACSGVSTDVFVASPERYHRRHRYDTDRPVGTG